MPSERFIEALNSQIADEFAAAHQYVAIGVYYEAETFPGLRSSSTSRQRRNASTR